MKKLLKTLVPMTIAAAVCISMGSAAFADDMSLDNLLSMLGDEEETTAETGDESEAGGADLLSIIQSMMDSEDTTEDTAETADFALYTLYNITYAVPSDWIFTDNDYQQDFVSTDSMAACSLACVEDAYIDVTDEEYIGTLVSTMFGDVPYTAAVITICGFPATWVDASVEEDGTAVPSFALCLQADNNILIMAATGLSDFDEDTFAAIVNSISIDGADGETDLSAAYDGEIPQISISEQDAEPAEEPAEEPADDQMPAADPASAEVAADAIDGSTGEEIVLVDDDVCTVKITSMYVDDYYPFVISIYTENKTDLNLRFDIEDTSVNDYMCYPYFGTTVSSGHKSNDEMEFRESDFINNNIEQVKKLEFTLTVCDADDWSADNLEELSFVIYPYGFDVEPQPAQTFDDNVFTVVDNDDVTMIIKGFGTSDYYFYADVYLENKTDKELEFSVSGDTAVNGYEISPYFWEYVMPGKMLNSQITWSLDDLAENNIDTIEELELAVSIEDPNDWSADPVFEENITVIPW